MPGVVGNSGLEISIHAPRKGSDAGPQRGARGQVWHFYPRSPQGERPGTVLVLRGRSRISIHAPREGSDLFKHHTWRPAWTFLSTLPARGATRPARSKPRSKEISIHAPREGSDRRPLRGATFSSPFLSTLPARGATVAHCVERHSAAHFYPRSPRGERREIKYNSRYRKHFYPRSPRGERRPTSSNGQG